MAHRDTIPRERRIRLTEIYTSVQGESTHAGKRCVFVRLTGCNLRCHWCDSEFTFTGGTVHDLDEVVAQVAAEGVPMVEITGGEPLLQPNVHRLMQRLLDDGHQVLIETSGSLSIKPIPDGVHIIMDLKCPDSGECEKNLWENLDHLRDTDEVKFVIASRRDFEWSRDIVREHRLDERVEVLFSPAWGEVPPRDLVDWILADRLNVRFQLQVHKVVWPSDARGV